MKSRKKSQILPEEVEALNIVAFLLDQEADNIEDTIPNARATDMSITTVGHETTIAMMIRGVAEWIRELVAKL